MVIKLKSGREIKIPSEFYNFELKQNGSVYEINYETCCYEDDVSYTQIHYTIKISSILFIEVNRNDEQELANIHVGKEV